MIPILERLDAERAERRRGIDQAVCNTATDSELAPLRTAMYYVSHESYPTLRAIIVEAVEALEAIRDEGGPGGAHEYAEQRVAEVALERIKELGNEGQ